MKGDDIKDRTLEFAIRVLNMVSAMPKETTCKVFSNQIMRSVASAGANYRAACRSKSRRDFINKLKIVEEELDETMYWLELIRDTNVFPNDRIAPLILENNELLAIIVKSITTAKGNEVSGRIKKKTGLEK